MTTIFGMSQYCEFDVVAFVCKKFQGGLHSAALQVFEWPLVLRGMPFFETPWVKSQSQCNKTHPAGDQPHDAGWAPLAVTYSVPKFIRDVTDRKEAMAAARTPGSGARGSRLFSPKLVLRQVSSGK